MNVALALTLATGVALIGSGILLWLWQILSAPDRPNYPTSGPVKRALMFLFAAAAGYRGLEVIYLARSDAALRVSDGEIWFSLLMFGLFAAFLVDHVRHWLPEKTHQNIRRLVSVARCGPRKGLIAARTSAMTSSTGASCPAADVVGPALAALSMQGMAVIAPNEGPSAVTESEPPRR